MGEDLSVILFETEALSLTDYVSLRVAAYVGAAVFLCSIKAGGFGINLTSANEVVLMDPWWNPAVEQQAYARAHRIGQNRDVKVFKLICKNTVEEQVVKLQDQKRQLSDGLGRCRLKVSEMVEMLRLDQSRMLG